jgi:hypothetical protein
MLGRRVSHRPAPPLIDCRDLAIQAFARRTETADSLPRLLSRRMKGRRPMKKPARTRAAKKAAIKDLPTRRNPKGAALAETERLARVLSSPPGSLDLARLDAVSRKGTI